MTMSRRVADGHSGSMAPVSPDPTADRLTVKMLLPPSSRRLRLHPVHLDRRTTMKASAVATPNQPTTATKPSIDATGHTTTGSSMPPSPAAPALVATTTAQHSTTEGAATATSSREKDAAAATASSLHSRSASGLTGSDLEDDEEDYLLPEDVAERLVRRTELRVSQVLSQSQFVQQSCRLYDLPRFEREDLITGDVIAYGGFSNVHDILEFGCETELTTGRNEGRRYIVKNLNPKLAFNPKKLVVGAKDLVMEAHFLSALSHDNIMELRGWSAAGISGFAETCRADGFFLVFDKLQETLSRRIATWRERAKETKKGSLITKNRTAVRMQLFAERIQAAIDIADAVQYLHARRIIYRDLKPANIGFDQNDVLKIFDFGLAVELPEGSDPNSTFNLAGNTGTSRYMAVEVIRKHPYNCKADVFSYSILLWELMALCKPYDGLVGQQVKECVSVFGERPAIPRTWPTNLRRILRRGWTETLIERPHISEVKEVLEKLLEASSGKPAGSKLFNK